MKNPSQTLSQFWDETDEIENLLPDLEGVAALPPDDKHRAAAVSLVRRHRSIGLRLSEVFDDGPGLGMASNPWRPLEAADLLPILRNMAATAKWFPTALESAARDERKEIIWREIRSLQVELDRGLQTLGILEEVAE